MKKIISKLFKGTINVDKKALNSKNISHREDINPKQKLDSVTIGSNTYEYDPDVIAYKNANDDDAQTLKNMILKSRKNK